jgi:hypothetical protein
MLKKKCLDDTIDYLKCEKSKSGHALLQSVMPSNTLNTSADESDIIMNAIKGRLIITFEARILKLN